MSDLFQPEPPVTWKWLLAHEPELFILIHECRAAVRENVDDPHWGVDPWFAENIRPRLDQLIGWNRPRREASETEQLLRSSGARDTAVLALWDAIEIEMASFGRRP